MNRVEPLDESVGTNSTALMESPLVEVEDVQVKDVESGYVNLEDNPSLDDAQDSVETLEKDKSIDEENENVTDDKQEKCDSNHSISDR